MKPRILLIGSRSARWLSAGAERSHRCSQRLKAYLPPSAAALEMLRQSRTNNAPPAERAGLAARNGMKRQCQRVVTWTMALLGLDLAKLCTHRGPPSAAVNVAALRDRGDITLRQADRLCQGPKLGGIVGVAFMW